ncbi:MAG: hypothetical protein NC543_07810 [bacterium]|nr:hypothetical protein [bacterium]MCM1373483.1 hypothetical protein [Muribaculum sp.]
MITESKEDYSRKIKEREILHFIYENGENFDYMELASHMEMTYGQLRKEIRRLLEKQQLVVREGVLKVSFLYEASYYMQEKEAVEYHLHSDLTEDQSVYIPQNFRSKFAGYS